jgi:hypothetical protein
MFNPSSRSSTGKPKPNISRGTVANQSRRSIYVQATIGSRIVILMLFVLTSFMAACVSTPCRFRITGSVTGEGDPAPLTRKLPVIIAGALRPIGFVDGLQGYDGRLSSWHHAKEGVDVVYDSTQSQLSIVDHNESEESDLVKRAVAAVTGAMESRDDVHVTFKVHANRWTDCLGP